VKVGVRIPCYRKWCGASEIRRIATRAEGLGFDSLWVQDHLVAPLGPPADIRVEGVSDWLSEAADTKKPQTLFEYYAGDDWWLDPYIVWGFLAASTTRVRLASDIVVVPYRNPLVQAKMLGTLDVLTGGRLVLGTGTGHVKAESEALGVDFEARGRMHDEYLRIIRCVLSGEEATFSGEFYRFGPLRTLIRTVRGECPPIYVGGNAPRSIRRAVELGDGWLPSMPDPGGLEKGLDALLRCCEENGRKVPPLVALSLPSLLRLASPNAAGGRRKLHSAAEAVELLTHFERQGVSEVSLGFPMPNEAVYLDQIEFFGTDVLPHLRAEAG
jgi:probable F420-dependent oxidoreductase